MFLVHDAILSFYVLRALDMKRRKFSLKIPFVYKIKKKNSVGGPGGKLKTFVLVAVY